MTNFERKQPAKKLGVNDTQGRAINPRWREIRERSILDFVNRVAGRMAIEANPAHQDKHLRAGLYNMALNDGVTFLWQGIEVTERMALGEWAATFKPPRDPNECEPFASRAEWEGFCESMRKLRDPNNPMIAREQLVKMGEDIEARQRPHAERMGWL